MRRLLLSLLSLAFLSGLVSAQTITETFGSGANAFSMDFVEIGNPGNAAATKLDYAGKPIPAGSVPYTYSIGKYEVSRDMITKANSAGSLGITMYDLSLYYGSNGVKRPATGVSWYEAAKYVNWLNTSTGNNAAYKFSADGTFQLWSSTDAGYNAKNTYRNSLAKYVIASSDEWYKAAYGSPSGTWYYYPTGSNSGPGPVSSGTAANTAVYSSSYGPADIDNAGGLSAWGTMAQGGNAWELIETRPSHSGSDWRQRLGGSWMTSRDSPEEMASWTTYQAGTHYEYADYGFRVVMISESSRLYLVNSVDQTKGGLTVSPNQTSYIAGDLVTVSASPLPGYLFSSWSGDISGTTASVTLTMTSNKNITANFGEDTRDSDADGLSNYQEILIYGTNPNQKDTNTDGIEDGQAVTLGYSPTLNFSALITHLQSHPPTGLYTASQMQAMAFGDLVLTKNPNGSFTLNYDIEQSTDLQSWLPYQSFNQQITNLPPDKAFIRIKAKQ